MSSNYINSFGNFPHDEIFTARPTSAQNVNVITPINIDLTRTSGEDPNYILTANSVQVMSSGIYFISFNIAWQSNASGNRFAIVGRLKNGSSNVAGAYTLTYARDTTNAEDGVNHWSGLVSLAANDILAFSFGRGASSDTQSCVLDTDDRSSIIIRKMSFGV